MNEQEILERAWAMPITNPAYPRPPIRFVNRQLLIITYRTDIEALIRNSDIFYGNHRFGWLEDAGYSAERCAELRPGIIYNSITLHGRSGPWVNRVGFDQTAGCVAGVMTLEGSPEKPELPMISVVSVFKQMGQMYC